jgi:hypothetical protein
VVPLHQLLRLIVASPVRVSDLLKMCDNPAFVTDLDDETPPPTYTSRRVAISPTIIIDSADNDDNNDNNDGDDDDDDDEQVSMLKTFFFVNY